MNINTVSRFFFLMIFLNWPSLKIHLPGTLLAKMQWVRRRTKSLLLFLVSIEPKKQEPKALNDASDDIEDIIDWADEESVARNVVCQLPRARHKTWLKWVVWRRWWKNIKKERLENKGLYLLLSEGHFFGHVSLLYPNWSKNRWWWGKKDLSIRHHYWWSTFIFLSLFVLMMTLDFPWKSRESYCVNIFSSPVNIERWKFFWRKRYF